MIKYIESIDGQLIPSRRGDWCRVADLNARLAEQEVYFDDERKRSAASHVSEMERITWKLGNWKIITAVTFGAFCVAVSFLI